MIQRDSERVRDRRSLAYLKLNRVSYALIPGTAISMCILIMVGGFRNAGSRAHGGGMGGKHTHVITLGYIGSGDFHLRETRTCRRYI